MPGIVTGPARRAILRDVSVTMRNHHDLARFQVQAAATVQPHRASPFRQQVVDDHMLGNRFRSSVQAHAMRLRKRSTATRNRRCRKALPDWCTGPRHAPTQKVSTPGISSNKSSWAA